MPTDLSRIRFGPSFRTGITMIDDQHQVLFDLIERVDECLSSDGASAAAQRQTVDDLVHYAIYHLTYEERLVARLGHEVELRSHAVAHDEFRRKANHFRGASDVGGPEPGAAELQAYLKDWLVRHILHSDIPLFQKIRQRSSATVE